MQFNNKNYTRGKLAKKNGDNFEEIISRSMLRDGISFSKIPSGCKWIGKRAIAVQTPFDFIAAYNQRAFLFDAKTTIKKTFSYSEIKKHQLESLFQFRINKINAGYVVYFSSTNEVIYFDALILKKLKPRESLKTSDGINIGKINNFSFMKILFPQ